MYESLQRRKNKRFIHASRTWLPLVLGPAKNGRYCEPRTRTHTHTHTKEKGVWARMFEEGLNELATPGMRFVDERTNDS